MNRVELETQIIALLNKSSLLPPLDQRELLDKVNKESGERLYKINDNAGGSL